MGFHSPRFHIDQIFLFAKTRQIPQLKIYNSLAYAATENEFLNRNIGDSGKIDDKFDGGLIDLDLRAEMH